MQNHDHNHDHHCISCSMILLLRMINTAGHGEILFHSPLCPPQLASRPAALRQQEVYSTRSHEIYGLQGLCKKPGISISKTPGGSYADLTYQDQVRFVKFADWSSAISPVTVYSSYHPCSFHLIFRYCYITLCNTYLVIISCSCC